MFYCASPPQWMWWFSLIALVPLFTRLFYLQSFREVFVLSLLFAFVLVFFCFHWVSQVAINFGGMPWIASKLVLCGFALFAEFQFVLLSLGLFWLYKKYKNIKILFVAPFIYVSLDFLYPKIFPNTIGFLLYPWNEFSQIAEFTGMYGLTFVILFINSLISWIFLNLRQSKKNFLQFAAVLFGTTVVLIFCHQWGKKRLEFLSNLEKSFTKNFKVSLIQGNIGDIDKLSALGGSTPAIDLALNTYKKMTLETIKRYSPDLVVWPETAYPLLYTHFQDEYANLSHAARDDWIKSLMEEIKTPLFFGGYFAIRHDLSHSHQDSSRPDGTRSRHYPSPRHRVDPSPKLQVGARHVPAPDVNNLAQKTSRSQDYNSIFLLVPPHELIGTYQKSILLAFGEYVPLGPFSGFVQDLIPAIASFGRGNGPTVMELKAKNIKISPQICYEGIYPEHSRQSVLLGADVLINITNDSWFGPTGEPWYHLVLTAFRSIELRRPLVRATNTGVSAIIGITGQVVQKTEIFSPAILEAELALASQPELWPQTFYLKHGEWFPKLCILLSLLFFTAIMFDCFYIKSAS